jgi:hypothetical protein
MKWLAVALAVLSLQSQAFAGAETPLTGDKAKVLRAGLEAMQAKVEGDTLVLEDVECVIPNHRIEGCTSKQGDDAAVGAVLVGYTLRSNVGAYKTGHIRVAKLSCSTTSDACSIVRY